MHFDEAYLFDASWLFFGAWSLILLIVGAIVFRRDFDLIPTSENRASQVKPTVSNAIR
jgi:hypothetical protein